ncbi:MAG: hypothetical protein EKK29_16170 [Hyphomicrobiales bacterium]|nr:MAG: hypothetical protein EKK29_16170 [Hyphomicrobiales bacterium]
MTPAALLAIAVAAACALGGCAAAHRLFNRAGASQAHCDAQRRNGAQKFTSLLLGALACGAVMFAALYLAPAP